jgi:ATP-dependent DNA helicase RecG
VAGLDTPVKYVRGVGPRVAEMLAAKDIQTAEDLLYHLPFRYEDRQNPRSLDELTPGETASVIAEVRGAALLRTRRAPLFEVTLGQGRLALKCIWFNAPYLEGKFHAGQTVAVYGKVEPSRSSQNLKMIQPQFEVLPDATDDAETQMLEVGRITPVYESLGGSRLASRWQRKTIFHLLEGLRGAVPECLPMAMLARLELPDRETALREAHFPPEGTPLAQLQASATPAHRRLIFEELFFLELGLELKRRRMRKRPGIGFATNAKVREAIREVLPFHPTAAQKRVLGEIVADMRAPSPMRRLLQGDVGSGKTIVALQAMLVAMENGPDGAHRDSGYAALSGHAQAAGKVEPQAAHRAADRLARRGPQAPYQGAHQPRRGATGDRDARADRRKGRVRPAGTGGGGRATPFWRAATLQADEEARPGWCGSARAGRAGDDRNADSAHAGALALWRPGRERPG